MQLIKYFVVMILFLGVPSCMVRQLEKNEPHQAPWAESTNELYI